MSTDRMTRSVRRAAVLGKPVAHSLSPVLHGAAYEALGLSGWSYERIELAGEDLAGFVAGLGPEWVGLSVTMPGKRAALEFADVATDRARAVGAANTLVRTAAGTWRADCTDIDGVRGALCEVAGFDGPGDGTGVILGAGGTAAAAVGAFAELGLRRVRLVVREPARAEQTVASARQAGLTVDVLRWDEADFAKLAGECAALVSTVPAGAVRDHAPELARARCLLDVIYDPWPTPLAEAVASRDGQPPGHTSGGNPSVARPDARLPGERYGGRLATGLDMLLHQAFGQVEQFTGSAAPREAMRRAVSGEAGVCC